ncbi:MAG: hypothetical protein ACJA1D_001668 [Polaribacter sp.]|jgi:hypothetical protein
MLTVPTTSSLKWAKKIELPFSKYLLGLSNKSSSAF